MSKIGKHVARLERRVAFLSKCISEDEAQKLKSSYDRAERAALIWALGTLKPVIRRFQAATKEQQRLQEAYPARKKEE